VTIATEVKMPRLSLTMESGVLVKWLKAEGDSVQKGEALAEIETDKANALLEAPTAGCLRQMLVEEGAEVPCNVTVGILTDTPDGPWEYAGDHAQVATTPAASTAPTQLTTPSVSVETQIQASPAAKHLARQLEIELGTVTGTGPRGRISSEDVQRAADERVAATTAPPAVWSSAERRIPLTKMRIAIAQRMIMSATTVPQFTVRRRVDMSRTLRFLDEQASLESGESQRATSPGIADVLHMAVSRTLLAHPEVNASFEAGDTFDASCVVLHDSVNIGFAVALPDGLIVPVIHRAHEMPLEQLAATRRRLQDEAGNDTLPAGALTGATFTVSNLGTMGVDDFVAIVNPPEAAILAVGTMQSTLVVQDVTIRIAPMLTLTVTADHRLLDGAAVARFLGTLDKFLSNPDAMA
jgi:pyruvate dehydrogenase E2 component (dihydrolipoamide acetyltransferase)